MVVSSILANLKTHQWSVLLLLFVSADNGMELKLALPMKLVKFCIDLKHPDTPLEHNI